MEQYGQKESQVMGLLQQNSGKDQVIVYISGEKVMKRLPPGQGVDVSSGIVNKFTNFLGENNVKVVEKSIENLSKRD